MSKPIPRAFDAEAAAEARKRAGLSQAAVAGAVGMSVSTVKMWEVGDRQPDEMVTQRLAEVLNVDPDTLRQALPDLAHATLATIRRSQRLTLADIAHAVGQSERTVKRVEDGVRLPDDPDRWAAAYHLSLTALAAAWRRSGA